MEKTVKWFLRKSKNEALKKANKEGLSSKFEKYFVIGFEEGFKKGTQEAEYDEEVKKGLAIGKMIFSMNEEGKSHEQIRKSLESSFCLNHQEAENYLEYCFHQK